MEDHQTQLEEANRRLLNISEYYYHTFKDKPGINVLEDLEKLCSVPGLNPNNAMDFQAEIKPEQLLFMREGQNQIVRYIKNMILYYEEGNNG